MVKQAVKKRILLTNDDGIEAPGLIALQNAVKELGETIIVAPEHERSASSHSITMFTPLRVNEHHINGTFWGYKVNGTPVDCVKIAITEIIKEPVDLVISGINLGPNTGISVIYSGTVAAAGEGALLGIPSFAISLSSYKIRDYRAAADFAYKFAKFMLREKPVNGTFFNINVPGGTSEEIKGFKFTSQGKGIFREKYFHRVDPFKQSYYWLTGGKIYENEDKTGDETAVKEKYISITPVKYELTDYDILEKYKHKDINGIIRNE